MAKYILVVDDSLTIRSSVEYVLDQAGYKVALASDGVEGINKIKSISASGNEISMIITDINMPNMDGITFTQKVKASPFRTTPILILTTETNDAKKQQGKAAGAAGWLVKPFQPEQLISVVEMLTN